MTVGIAVALPEPDDVTSDGEALLEAARGVQQSKGGSLAEALYGLEGVSERKVLALLGRRYGLPVLDPLPDHEPPVGLTERVAIQFLKKHGLLPLQPAEGPGLMAVSRPEEFQAADDLTALLGLEGFDMVLAAPEAVMRGINRVYDQNRHSAAELVQDLEDDSGDLMADLANTTDLLDDTSDAPIVKLVNHILAQCIKSRASDIHIESYQDAMAIRQRVDGILYDLVQPPKHIQSALISRIKVMADLNIAEKRLPQDGRIDLRVGDQEVDVRVSTIPTAFGERVVLRLLNKTRLQLDLGEIGLDPERLGTLRKLIRMPHGIILVTGPTGSGKTTTLYGILSDINTADINIITIEDPIEYQLRGISQIQVNPKIELTFARGLRSIVRQDPDVIMVGEIRDRETADIAIQSALTGHLVLSTLHTNDSASAITRLVDIGAEPFLISSAVIAVVAQRLVRVLCQSCKTPYTPDTTDLQAIGMDADRSMNDGLFEARGCEACLQTGFKGRSGIFEILTMDQELKQIVLETFDSQRIKAAAVSKGMESLRQDGIRKVLAGTTTIAEVLRVTQH